MKPLFSYPNGKKFQVINLLSGPVFTLCHQICPPASPDKEKGLTASMVNNYVKHGYISKPEKKKYQRKQIARLIAITTLKSVFSIQEIAQTLNTLHTDTNSEGLYNAFVDYMNEDIDPANPIIQASCQTVKLYHQTLALVYTETEEEETNEY